MKALVILAVSAATALLPQNIICCKFAATASSSPVCGNTTADVLAPPASGTYDYNTFKPDVGAFPAVGSSYVDPVLGCTVTRLSNDYPNATAHRIYAANGWENSNATLAMVTHLGSGMDVVSTGKDVATYGTAGTVVRDNLSTPNQQDMWFGPVDPVLIYYLSGTTLRTYSVTTNTTALVKDFGVGNTLGDLGGAFDITDKTGRYWMVTYGGKLNIWDSIEDAIYTGAPTFTAGQGYNCGIAVSGGYMICSSGSDNQSWALNHGANSIGSSVQFWTLGGGHSALVHPSTGGDYTIVSDCSGTVSYCGLYLANVATDVSAMNNATELATGTLLLAFTVGTGNDIAGDHYSCAKFAPGGSGSGDWCVIEVLVSDDNYGGPTTPSTWRKYTSELIQVNVVTLVTHRLAHHRSRGMIQNGQYYGQPRPSISFDGTRVFFTSNFNFNPGGAGYGDLWMIDTTVANAPPAPLALARILRGEVTR